MKEFDYSLENLKRTIRADYFGRNAYIRNLINYISDSEGQTTFAISGDWGSGKTVFMHQFMAVMQNQDMMGKCGLSDKKANEYEIFYYNAWENELMKKPSIALLSSLMGEYYLVDSEDRENAKNILTKIGNIVVKLGSAGILSLEDFINPDSDETDVKQIQQTFSEAIDYVIKKTGRKKVIIIIDELDRCKPTSVIKLLEEVKHFYSHESLCFLFSADLKQLGHTIKKLYGSEFDSDLYMQRFFDAIFTLNGNSYEKYIDEELGYSISDTNVSHEICKVAIAYNGLTVRETNKFIKRIKACEKSIFANDEFYMENYLARVVFVPWGIALKYKNSHKYNAFINGEYKASEIKDYLDTSKELPRWLKECYLGRKAGNEDVDIYKVVFELYQQVFKQTKFKYYLEQNSGHINKNMILSFIEF